MGVEARPRLGQGGDRLWRAPPRPLRRRRAGGRGLSQVDFYHLRGLPLDRVLPRLAERVLAGGGRLLVVSADERQLDVLDAALWTWKPESFLPHGRDDADRQPILLASALAPVNGARAVALVDGGWREEALAFDRVFHLFDEDRVEDARAAWRTLGAREGVGRSFWQRGEGGGWTRAA